MAQSQSSEALRRPTRNLYVLYPIIVVSSLLLGYFGLAAFLHGKAEYGHRFQDLVYYDVQLFVLGSDPLQSPGPYPWTLDIARFTAPAVTIYTVVESIRRLLSAEISRRRARRMRGHAIVCGDSPLADALTRRLWQDDRPVIEIRTQPDDFVLPGEPIRIVGDARDPEVLRSAGIEHATTVYACAAESATNIAVAVAVARAVSAKGDALMTYSLIPDPDFCATVQAFFLGRSRNPRVRSDFFNTDHIAARRLFLDDRLAMVGDRPPSLLIAGNDGLVRALAVEAARHWRGVRMGGSGPLRLTIIGNDATTTVNELKHRFPFFETACECRTVPGDLLDLIQRGRLCPPDHALIMYADEELALKTAMTAERRWRGHTQRITVRLEGALIGLPSEADLSLSVASGNLHVFGAVGAAADPDLIRDDLTERIARVLHERYLEGRSRREARAIGRAMVPWDRLPSGLRQANRAQAEDIGRKLSKIGYAIAPRHVEHKPAQLSPDEIDRLALMEHERWCQEKQSAGWRYARVRDEQRRLHPGLVSWAELDPVMRMRNYDPVMDLPGILGDAGFQIVPA